MARTNRKKVQKTQKRRYSRQKKVKTQVCYSRNISSLPDEILTEIFSYFDSQDVRQARLVCNRWNHILKDKRFWNPAIRFIEFPETFIMDVALFPSFISHIKLECNSVVVPFSLPEIMAKFHERNLSLKTLIIEDIHLVKNLHPLNQYRTRQLESYNAQLIREAKSNLEESFLKILETEYFKEEDIELDCTVMPELKALFLSRVVFGESHFFSLISPSILPKLTVLDLSFSKPGSLCLKTCDLFSTMLDLEELYLAGWNIKDNNILNFIKNARKLRALDLTGSSVTEDTILALQENSVQLERLCVSGSLVTHIRTSSGQKFFPHLQYLCLARTYVRSDNIENLLSSCLSLKHVNISRCFHISPGWSPNLSQELKRKIFDPALFCAHFSESRHYIDDR